MIRDAQTPNTPYAKTLDGLVKRLNDLLPSGEPVRVAWINKTRCRLELVGIMDTTPYREGIGFLPQQQIYWSLVHAIHTAKIYKERAWHEDYDRWLHEGG